MDIRAHVSNKLYVPIFRCPAVLLLTTPCYPSEIDPTDAEAILTWDSVPSLTLAAINYYDGIALVPA